MEVTAPVNKAPSVIKSEDKTPTPILKVGNSGTTVVEKDLALVNKIRIMHARQGYDETIGRFVARLHASAGQPTVCLCLVRKQRAGKRD